MSCSTKHINPALGLYKGANFVFSENNDIANRRANGTLFRVVFVCRKDLPLPLGPKCYDGKNVYTVNVSDLEYNADPFPPC